MINKLLNQRLQDFSYLNFKLKKLIIKSICYLKEHQKIKPKIKKTCRDQC